MTLYNLFFVTLTAQLSLEIIRHAPNVWTRGMSFSDLLELEQYIFSLTTQMIPKGKGRELSRLGLVSVVYRIL